MTDIKWIKLSVNMFDDEKIKLIRTMPEGDKIIVIWVQMLCLAGKTNDNGSIYMGQNIYYTDEMMAAICEQPVNTMRLALQTLERFGMIEKTNDGLIDIVNWEKHQNIEGMERIRRQNAERQQLHYYRKKIKSLDSSIDVSQLPNNVEELKTQYENLTLGLTLPHAPEEEKEKEEEKDKEEDKEKNTKSSLSDKSDPIPYEEIVSYLNQKTGSKYRHSTKSTKTLIKARYNEGFTVEDFKEVIDNKANDWLHDMKMAEYLRPQTLFGTKFESYLNAPVNKKRSERHDTSEYEGLF